MDRDNLAAVREILEPEGDTEDVKEPPVEDIPEDTPEVVADDQETDTQEPDTQEPEDPPDGEDDPDKKYNVTSLAEAIGWEAKDLYDVDVPMGDGIEPVKLGQLKDEYQSVIREKQGMLDKLSVMETDLEEARSGVQAGQQMDQEVLAAMAQIESLKARYESVDWPAIEADDPGGAALMRQKYQEAFQQADGAIGQARHNVQVRQQGEMRQAATRMIELIPEWRDDAVRQADQAEMRTSMLAEGMTNELIDSIREPLAMVHWRKHLELMKFKAEYDAANSEAVSKVKKAPKVLKGGARARKDPNNQVKELKKALSGAGPSKRRKAEIDLGRAILGLK